MANMHAKPALTVRLPEHKLTAFRAEVARRGDTIAGAIEQAIDEYVQRNDRAAGTASDKADTPK